MRKTRLGGISDFANKLEVVKKSSHYVVNGFGAWYEAIGRASIFNIIPNVENFS